MANTQIPTVRVQDVANLPKDEFAFPGPERDRLVEAILNGRKAAATRLMAENTLLIMNHYPPPAYERFWWTQITSQLPSLGMPR